MSCLKILLISLLSLFLFSPAQAQSESKSLSDIAREQQNVGKRIEQILKKMDRLIRKNELEGKQHTADLIRKAKAEVEARTLDKRIESLDKKIRDSQLTVVGEQEKVLKDLEDIFAILQDRSDLERLEDLISTYKEGLKGLSKLSDEQDEILKETQKLVYDEASFIDSVRKKLNEIKNDQQDLNSRVSKMHDKFKGEDKWWDLTKKVEILAADQADLAEETFNRMEDTKEGKDYSDLSKKQEEQLSSLNDLLDEMQKTADENAEGMDSLNSNLREELKEAAEEIKEAGEDMKEAVSEINNAKPSDGWMKEKAATEKLDKVVDKMTEAGRSAFEDKQKQNMQAAGAQDHISEQMKDMQKKLDKLKNIRQGNENRDPATDEQNKKTAEDIQQKMKEAGEMLEEYLPDAADQLQKESIESLEELDKKLKEQHESASSSPQKNSLSKQEREEKMKELADRQKELEEQARDLMRRMRELPDQKPVEHLSDAADNMAGASDELDQNMGEEAEQDEQEAKKHLENAMNEMTKEEQKYQNIRQQELLFRVQQALELLKEEQDGINKETAELDLTITESGRVTRRQRKSLKNLAAKESGVKDKTQEIVEKIAEEASTVFSWVLERNMDDLDSVIDYIKRREIGPVVQTIQEDISDRMAELIASLKNELKRRQENQDDAPPPGGEQPQQPRKNPLIPPVAELLMIKSMEENALRRLEEFMRLNPDLMEGGDESVEKKMIERMGHRHSSITELFKKMVEKLDGPKDDVTPQEEGK